MATTSPARTSLSPSSLESDAKGLAQLPHGGAARLNLWRWRLCLSLALLAVGLLHLPYPLGGDQALFLHYAQGIASGQSLYVDLWDNKQPGIFWFYRLAGALFGFSAWGVHLLELLWLALAALALRVALGPVMRSVLARELVPVFGVGLLLWCARLSSMGQVEVLVALPLVLCLWASLHIAKAHAPVSELVHARPIDSGSNGMRWHVMWGVAAASVALLKLVLVVIPAALWLVAMLWRWKQSEARSALGAVLAAMVAGCALALPLAATAGWFALKGHLAIFLWTQLQYPGLVLAELQDKPLENLLQGALWWLLTFAPAPVLLWLGRHRLASRRAKNSRRTLQPVDPRLQLDSLSLTWLLVGAFCILIQKLSWWGYHFQLLVPPMGLLLLTAFDRVWLPKISSSKPSLLKPQVARAVAVGVLAAIAITGGIPMAKTGMAWWAALRAPADQRGFAFRAVIDPQAPERWRNTAFLRESRLKGGRAYVFGNPNYLLDAGQRQALPIHGWSWEAMLESQWAVLPRMMEQGRPWHIYIDKSYAEMVARRSPATMDLLERRYERLPEQSSFDGAWYRLKLKP